MSTFYVTEEQYNHIMAESVNIDADVSASGGDVKKAIDTAKQEAVKSGANLDDTKISVPANYTEGKMFTKAQLEEMYHQSVRDTAKKYTAKEFYKLLKSK